VSRDWQLYRTDILRCCEKIRRFTTGLTQAQFLADDRTYDAVVRNLEILGEAAKHLPEHVCQQMPQVEWRKVAGLRDWLAHAYFGIDPDILWDVIQNKLVSLEQTARDFGASQSLPEEEP